MDTEYSGLDVYDHIPQETYLPSNNHELAYLYITPNTFCEVPSENQEIR